MNSSAATMCVIVTTSCCCPQDREQLLVWRGRIETYLHDHLKLELNTRQRLAPVNNGIDFLGYVVRRDYKLVRRRVVLHLREKLRLYEAQLLTERGGVHCQPAL